MAIDRDLIAAVARAFHGRNDIDEATLRETAERVESFVTRARLVDEQALRQVPPAISFHAGAEPYRITPQVGAPLYEQVARSSGGTGYGGRTGNTGVAAPPPVERPAPGVSQGPEFLWWSATEMAEAIRRRDLSPVELTRAALDRLAAVDKALNAFITVTADEAMAQARALENSEPKGPLHGVPIALKDLFETAGVRTTAGSRLLADYVPSQDGTAVRRLKEAGAVIIGKTATHEFAFGATSDSPYHGPVHNPWDLTKIPAGSSGGSAAAVAAGIVPIAMATDTGGSIRMPAAHCGAVGLKPTYGRVSKAGVLPLSWSLDHVGPISRSVADTALVLGLLAGPDPLDPSAVPVPVDDYLAAAGMAGHGLRGVRIGVPLGWMDDGRVDAEVQAAFVAGLQRLKDLGAEVVEVEFPPADVMTFVNRLLALAEGGAYHAPLIKERAADYAPDVRLRFELGQFVSARDYLVGQRLRTEIARQVHGVMAQVDALVTPTLPIPPAGIGQAMWAFGDGHQEAVVEAMIRYTSPFSVTGQPAFSLPCGFTRTGLPIGLQLVGRPFGEAGLIRIAAAFEAAGGPMPRPSI